MSEQPITTLAQFYALMSNTRKVRKHIVSNYLETGNIESSSISHLENALNSLNAIEGNADGKQLSLGEDDDTIPVDIEYEVTELQKDILFLTKSEDALIDHFHSIYPTFTDQFQAASLALKEINFKNFITDRDGTVNNYCGRYLSSIQSVYNALFLTRFARNCVENGVMLTSAPLENGGMIDICTMPNKTFFLAGSKGREYRDKKWNRNTYPIDTAQQKQLDIINQQISELIKDPQFLKFSYIGSGFQQKFGQTTIARQDINNSITKEESNDFLEIITNLVFDIDREKRTFRIEDTGLDIEIILTISDPLSNDDLKDFDKADGVAFLNDRLHLGIEKGPNLICGDTGSDIPMLSISREKTLNTTGIFVTTDKKLKKKVSAVHPDTLFLDNPDILVSVLNELAK